MQDILGMEMKPEVQPPQSDGETVMGLHIWSSFFKPTIYSFAQSLSNVPHPLASVNGIVPSVIAGVRGMVELPPFEGFAEINFGNVSHFVGIDHT